MLYALDINGCVINEASLDRISDEYRPLIDEVVVGAKETFGGKLRSIYVRGSVSVGRAQPNISDIDMVILLHEDPTDRELFWRKDFADMLGKKYDCVTMVDLTSVTLEELLKNTEFKRLQIYLATQSVCLYGEDVLDILGAIHPDRKLALWMYAGLDRELQGLEEYFLDPSASWSYLGEVRRPEFWCVWTMRTLLRSGLGLVMCSRPVYTQDLPTCYEEFVKEFPELEGDMKQALVWAHTPTSDKHAVGAYLREFLPKYLELWKKMELSDQ